jgi:hypothetical protein
MWGAEEEDLIEHYPLLKEFGYKDGHITINSLEAFMDLVNKTNINGGVILTSEREVYDPKSKKWVGTGVHNIEIYDGYRE